MLPVKVVSRGCLAAALGAEGGQKRSTGEGGKGGKSRNGGGGEGRSEKEGKSRERLAPLALHGT